MNTNQTAVEAYIAKNASIIAKLEQLQQLAADHFGQDPDNINWGHVGDLGRIEEALDEIITE